MTKMVMPGCLRKNREGGGNTSGWWCGGDWIKIFQTIASCENVPHFEILQKNQKDQIQQTENYLM